MTMTIDRNSLNKTQLFQDLTSEEFSKIKELLHTKTFPAETSIMTAEQPGESVFIILQGTVKIQTEQADGSYVILAVLGPGEVIGEMSLVDRMGRSASAITLEATTLCWMNRNSFWQCMQTMPTLALNLTRVFSRRLRLANEQTQSLATQDVYGRVAHQILTFAREYSQPASNGTLTIPFRLTQSDLAGMIGATRVRVNQVLMTYKQMKYVSVDQNFRITVHNPTALAQRCGAA